MKYYIKCLVDFTDPKKKIILRGPEGLEEQEIRHRLNLKYKGFPVTQIEVVETEAESPDEELFAE